MKFKGLITSFIAGASFFTAINTSPVLAGQCDDAPPTGDKFIPTGPNTWKIRSTVMLPLTSNNERKVAFAFRRLELEAQKKLVEFVNTKVKKFDNLSDSAKQDAITGVNGEDATDETLTEAIEIISGIQSSGEELLRGSQELGRCHVPGEKVMLTRGINSETQTMISNTKSNNTESNIYSPTKTYNNRDVKGYSGYGDLDDF